MAFLYCGAVQNRHCLCFLSDIQPHSDWHYQITNIVPQWNSNYLVGSPPYAVNCFREYYQELSCGKVFPAFSTGLLWRMNQRWELPWTPNHPQAAAIPDICHFLHRQHFLIPNFTAACSEGWTQQDRDDMTIWENNNLACVKQNLPGRRICSFELSWEGGCHCYTGYLFPRGQWYSSIMFQPPFLPSVGGV